MFAKISLTAAFLLMMTPPIACASNHDATNPASIALPADESPTAGIVVAQDANGIYEGNQSNQENENENENGNDNETNENADENQNADGTETDQENTAGNQQSIPPQVLGGTENDAGDGQQPQSINPYPGGAQLAPQVNGYAQPINPYQ
ncbi:MAG TPA: hypothetical protein VE243_10935 [Candidatus Acidoferrum sp.]|nr:hypothetical protein [Candidatus Acidoferrum sp.]